MSSQVGGWVGRWVDDCFERIDRDNALLRLSPCTHPPTHSPSNPGILIGIFLGVSAASALLLVITSLSEHTAAVTSRFRSLAAVALDPHLPPGHVPLENIQEAEYVGKVRLLAPPTHPPTHPPSCSASVSP